MLHRKKLLRVCGAILIQFDAEYQGPLQKADVSLLPFLPGNTPVVAGIGYLIQLVSEVYNGVHSGGIILTKT